MRVQVLFLAFLQFGLFFSQSNAAESANCFDFTKPITAPMHPRLPAGESKSGKLAENRYWGATRGQVHQPISRVLKDLLDHGTTRGARVAKMHITPLEDTNFLSHQVVNMEVDPFPFVTVSWEEEWGFSLLKGTVGAPESVLASFQKTTGTSHIKHLCGNIWLEKVSPDLTDIDFYEEAEATQRTEADTLKGIQGTLKAIGALKTSKTP
jgi:hypothetical protein